MPILAIHFWPEVSSPPRSRGFSKKYLQKTKEGGCKHYILNTYGKPAFAYFSASNGKKGSPCYGSSKWPSGS